MSDSKQCNDAAQALEWVLAGDARLTLVSAKTGDRYTYRIQQAKQRHGPNAGAPAPYLYFVNVLVGSDNITNYMYLGLLTYTPASGWRFTPKKASGDCVATSVLAFSYFSRWLFERSALAKDIELWHSGKCVACGRTLTVPESIETGFGPECSKRR